MKVVKIILLVICLITSILFCVYGFIQKAEGEKQIYEAEKRVETITKEVISDFLKTNNGDLEQEYYRVINLLKVNRPNDPLVDSLWKSSDFLQIRDSLLRTKQP